MDTLGHLLAVQVAMANGQVRAQVDALAKKVQRGRGLTLMLAFVDQEYAGKAASLPWSVYSF
ncbi:hypothetical protein [Stenotrophomonas sp. NRRL B-14846]|uniref:hypothetical protein n=1 Tax=Stenotrophomonas sp. NRRL B-14846 TaxID=3162882 RepID=UPI003D28C9A4